VIGRDPASGSRIQISGERDLFAGIDIPVGDDEVGTPGSEELDSACGELGSARDVVRVRVGVRGIRDRDAAVGGRGEVAIREPGWVDDERPGVTEVNEV
jgi:hypothetical protein